MDVLTKAQRSFCMSQNKGKNTKPEIMLRKALWNQGLRYRTHLKLPGRPDVVFTKHKIAIFIDGCYWHGCPQHRVLPKTNRAFWLEKFRKTKLRDNKNSKMLESSGWKVIRIWEHDVKQNLVSVLQVILKALKQRSR
jgi:DNA mismatch endonuclease, patch repair protein